MRKIKLEELKRLTVEEFKKVEKQNILIVLDNIRSMNNVGSVFRTSDAFRIKKIFLCGISGIPPHRDIHKTALGSENSVDWEYFQDADDLIDILKNEGYIICSVEQTTSSTLLQKVEFDLSKQYVFVFGNEVDGVSSDIISKSDVVIEIPQFGYKHSLNISVAAGIVMWDFTNKTNFFLD